MVYAEWHDDIIAAITREKALKALKAWNRAWKFRLIEAVNPDWADMYDTLA